MLMRRAMMPMTTNSSTSVKALRFFMGAKYEDGDEGKMRIDLKSCFGCARAARAWDGLRLLIRERMGVP
jgi:hypothetical protein